VILAFKRQEDWVSSSSTSKTHTAREMPARDAIEAVIPTVESPTMRLARARDCAPGRCGADQSRMVDLKPAAGGGGDRLQVA